MKLAQAILIFLSLWSASCSRDLPNAKLNLGIPFRPDQSGFSVDDKLSIVIINVHIPSRGPVVRQFKFDGQNVTLGQDINLEITDIPRGTGYLVQFLGVYENSLNGAMKFYYGDATADVLLEAQPVEITAENFAQSDKFIRFAGRYVAGTTPTDHGPTGNLIAQFQPPNGKPRMIVAKTAIVNGWFNAFSTDTINAPFRYVLAETGEVIFDNLTSASPVFSGLGSERMKIIKPMSARREGGNGSVRMTPEMNLYLGYWGAGSGRNVCYVNTNEALFGHYTDATMTVPLDFIGGGGATAGDARIAGGGSAESYSVFLGAGGTCSGAQITAGNALVFQHQHAGDEEAFAGFSVPFKLVRPFYEYQSYVTGTYQTSPVPKWTLNWKFMPQTVPVLTGVEVFYKVSTSSSGDNSERNCGELTSRGFTSAGVATGGAETFDFVHAGMTNANYYNYRFALCAYRDTGVGRQYLGNYIESNCMTSGCSGLSHFGWAPAAATSTISSSTSMSSLGGASQRVTDVPLVNDDYTVLTVGSGTPFTAGSEVLVMIQGANGSTPCGSESGSTLDYGKFAFARVLGASSTLVKISRGTFLDAITTTNLNSSVNSATFCYVQIVTVPHFRDLTLTSIGQINLASAFDYATGGGGIIAFRVNGTLDLGSSGNAIRVDGKGYPGGSNTIPHGGGQRQNAGATAYSHLGGTDDGGGAGLGNGGGGSAANGGIAVTSTSGSIRLMFGGGGASVSPPGFGAGGGIIFAMADRVISAGGEMNAAGGAGFGSGGAGGGGGTVALITRNLSGSGVNFNAPGGNAQGTGSYGGGGGGYTYVMACQNTVTSTGQNISGGSLTNTGTAGTSVAHSPYVSSSNFWFCNN